MTEPMPNAQPGSTETKRGLSWQEIITTVVLILAIWVPRTLALDQFVTADEPFWLTRSANFNCALGQGHFAQTFQSEHPGVMIMWAGAAGVLQQVPHYTAQCRNLNIGELEILLEQLGVSPIDVLAAGRFFSVLAITVLLILGYFIARRLVGPFPALVGALLIAFDPFYTAHSRVLHLDGMLTTLMLVSFLAFIAYLRERRSGYLILSAIIAGLSWLTKSPGVFLIPIVGLLALLDLFRRERPFQNGWHFDRLLRQWGWPLLLWGLIGILCFILFWPAMWANPIEALTKIIAAAQNYAEDAYGTSRVFFNGVIVDNGELGSEFYYFYPLNYLWRTTPVVLLGLAAALIAVILPRKELHSEGGETSEPPSQGRLSSTLSPARPRDGGGEQSQVSWEETRFALLSLLLYALLFTVAISLGNKKFDRYQLPVYPALDLVAAVGWVEAALWVKRTFRPTSPAWAFLSRIQVPLLLSAAVVTQIVLTALTFPYYFSYYNPWMGGPRKALEVMLIGRGEGIEQAAHYLNQQPNAEALNVYSWYNRGSFSYFFNGESTHMPTAYQWSKDEVKAVLAADYVVIYVHQWQRKMPERFLNYLAPQTPVFSFSNNGIEYTRVYKLEHNAELTAEPTYVKADAQVGEPILLEGYSLPKREVTAGETLPIVLSWRALQAPEESLKVFIHILNEAGALAAQSDSEPVFWLRPTNDWEEGEQIVDRYYIPLPPELPAGTYTVMAGMYRSSGERLPITQGGAAAGDVLNLGQITLKDQVP